MGSFATYNGEVTIPEDKKQEFNENMIKLLQLGGMVEIDEVNLHGKHINLIRPVELDDEGICEFNYNYFEDDPWDTARFYSDTNRLISGKIGSDEFSFVICAAYLLIELYSDDYGWAETDGEVINDVDYVQWINYILNKDFSMKKRFELWKLCESLYMKESEYGYQVSGLEFNRVFEFVPSRYEEYMGGTELADILYSSKGTDETMAEAPENTYAAEVYSLKKKLEAFYQSDPNEGQKCIWNMITLPREQRKSITGTAYDELAQISLRIAARVYVYLSSEILNFPFWEEWKKIYKDVYQDEEVMSYASDEIVKMRIQGQTASLGKKRTSEFLRNDGYFTFHNTPDEIKYKDNYYISDDDLMYWWDGTETIVLSDKMINQIKEWKNYYDDILTSNKDEDYSNYDMLNNLINVLNKAEACYKRVFAFQNMFYEFLENSKDVRYISAIQLFNYIIEDKKQDGQIIEKVSGYWSNASKNVTFNEGRVTIKRFLSLMANKVLREQYFGF